MGYNFVTPSEDTELLIPEARVDDLDLDDERDRAVWENRLQALAEARLAQAKLRLQELGVVDRDGALVSDERPRDMLLTSDTSVETG